MSLVHKTIQAFPRGRTTEELLVLVGASFAHDKRMSTLAELDQLLREGKVYKSRDGRWRPAALSPLAKGAGPGARQSAAPALQPERITATLAQFTQQAPDPVLPQDDETTAEAVDPHALMRYWRSALRADPRGATRQVLDKFEIEWALLTGRGPVGPKDDQTVRIAIDLDALPPKFQEALVRREGNENVLALGWPMSVARHGGGPVFLPVGLFAAGWSREGEQLILTVDADDVLVNPEWLKSSARPSGWTRESLADLFHVNDGLGLRTLDFLDRLQGAVASQIRGRISGLDLVTQLDPASEGIFDSAGIFLPTESSFTAGAARDLDTISGWPRDQLARTALAPVLGLEAPLGGTAVPAIDAVPLNQEQLRAVRGACDAPLTVVTGPPGTGKSQAIVSMAASVLAQGGSVLVASKNHQALDAVEDRLGGLAPEVPFCVRTLNPDTEVDVSLTDALKQMIAQEGARGFAEVDAMAMAALQALAQDRGQALDSVEAIADLECAMAEVLDRIELRKTQSRAQGRGVTPPDSPPQIASPGWMARVLAALRQLFARQSQPVDGRPNAASLSGLDLAGLQAHLEDLRQSRAAVPDPADPIQMGNEIRKLTEQLLPKILHQRTGLSADNRQQIAAAFDDWQFEGGRGHPRADLAQQVIAHRPLWLASILGTPRRLPLHEGLFDLVIFDEASQCDIATAIPLFARAKRAVVVGDDRQLSFIPQLGQSQDRNLMQAQGLAIKGMGRFAQSKRSLFDMAVRVPGAQRVTLRQQYRSAGPIVEYISETFYGGELQTAYDPQRLIVPDGVKPGLAWQDVPAPGIPQSGNVNPSEVAAVTEHLKKLLVQDGYTGSIGVISPFRAQVIALDTAIRAAIPETRLVAQEVKVGTVDGFQGQERDLILFSPCIGPRSPQSGLTFFQRDARRLNVAISRARAVAMIFGDLGFARSGKSKALQRLAAKATEPRARGGEGVFDSDWERRVYHALKARGLDPQPQYDIAGRRLDFALFGASGVKLDLEVDGRRKTSDLWRDHQMQSMGWRVRRFWVDELQKDMEACLDRVEQDLS